MSSSNSSFSGFILDLHGHDASEITIHQFTFSALNIPVKMKK
ncbi:hypothetical protein HOLDEFILI_04176 [Holdemania filiformis DSM 12042]|uniref:Uncharacterized protein n=1 Tax=Holdemania filiformis DSM 12042 TaxID=545696 RepID=B9YEA3_9FIRM|nr:hypothetical protein HOLDEFILI_04176 [Holdemania filiformis DSM 12042]